jgi:hypothetical protein
LYVAPIVISKRRPHPSRAAGPLAQQRLQRRAEGRRAAAVAVAVAVAVGVDTFGELVHVLQREPADGGAEVDAFE